MVAYRKEIDAQRAKSRYDLFERLCTPLREGSFVVWELAHAWPDIVVRCAQKTEDAVELVDFGVAREQWAPVYETDQQRGTSKLALETWHEQRVRCVWCRHTRSRRLRKSKAAAQIFFFGMMQAPCSRIAVTNRVTISAKIGPSDQMSTGQAYWREPRRISGARYQRVTTCKYTPSGLGKKCQT